MRREEADIKKVFFFFNLKDYTQKGLELIKEFSEVAGYEINRSFAFLYTNNEISERQCKKKSLKLKPPK